MLFIFGHGCFRSVCDGGAALSPLGDGVHATAGRRVTYFSLRLVDTVDGYVFHAISIGTEVNIDLKEHLVHVYASNSRVHAVDWWPHHVSIP